MVDAHSSTMGFTRLSKVLVAALIAGYALVAAYPPAIEFLGLIPGRTLPLVWNLVSAGFIHKSALLLVFNVLAVLFLSRLVEPYYGSREYLKFLAIVNLLTNLATFVTIFVMFIATQKGKVLYIKLAGFHGVVAGVVVAVKQVMPHHEVKLFGLLGLKASYLPSIFLPLGVAVCVATGSIYDTMLLCYGTYFAWLYLRFFQQQSDLPVKGDASDDFKFSSFFPSALAPAIDPICSIFSTIFRLRHTDSGDSARFASLPTSAVGPDATETTRRRERGAKALEERLKKGTGEGDQSPVAKGEP